MKKSEIRQMIKEEMQFLKEDKAYNFWLDIFNGLDKQFQKYNFKKVTDFNKVTAALSGEPLNINFNYF